MGSGAERETDEGTESTLAVPAGLLSSTAFLLAMVGAESRKRWVEGLARWALRPSHFAALMALDEIGPISQQDLARLVGVDPRNLVPVVDLLEQRSLVERQPHPTDRRRHAVRLTPGGQQLLAGLRESGEVLEREMLAALDKSEQNTLRELLLKLLPGVSGKGG